MKVVATADLHGTLPKIPECDLLLIAGDICPDHPAGKAARYELADVGASWQRQWLLSTFENWLTQVPARRIVAIGGNHDFVFDNPATKCVAKRLPWTYLENEEVTVEGLRIFGTPYVPGLRRWAFHASDRYAQALWESVPAGVDILMSHGPPRGHLDFVAPQFGSCHVGCVHHDAELPRIRPAVNVFGHIHEQYGHVDHSSGVRLRNVSHVNEHYEPVNPPVVLDLG